MAKKPETNQAKVAEAEQNNELYVISKYLKDLKFSRRVMGVDEADVWKKIEKLCELYDDALLTEREKNKKLTRQLNECVARLKKLLTAAKHQEE